MPGGQWAAGSKDQASRCVRFFWGRSMSTNNGEAMRPLEVAPPPVVAPGTGIGLLVFGITAYCFISLTTVYFNWWLFTSGFKFPVFVSWIQQVVGMGLFYFGSQAGRLFPSLRLVFPATKFSTAVMWKVLPLSASFVLSVGLSNICLQKTLISTYQVARSLTLLFVIMLSYYLLGERQTPIVLVACALMVVGFVVGSLDPTTLSLGGLLAGGFSSLFQSLYNVLIKRTLPHTEGDNQKLLNYNVLLSAFLFLPMTLVSEDLTNFRQALGLDPKGPSLWLVWGGMLLSGLMGTTLNMTQYLLVKVTSPLTFNIVGFSKSLLQSLGGIVLMGDKTSAASLSGIGLSMLGSGLYTKAKATQNRKAAQIPQEVPAEDKETTDNEAEMVSFDSSTKVRVHQYSVSHSVETAPSPSAIPKPPSSTDGNALQS